jgi:predicted nucleotidyltransferase
MNKIGTLPPKLMKKGLKEKLLKLCEENDINFMAIFGSFVRGEEKRTSDIDTAIEFADKSHKSLFDLVHIENELKKYLGERLTLE